MTPLSKLERRLFLLAAGLSPLYFVQLAGKAVAPWDFLFPVVTVLYLLRTRSVPVGPTARYTLGVLSFLAAIVISTMNSPFPIVSFFDSGQYLLILLFVVPATLAAAEDRQTRWKTLLAVTLSTNLLAVSTELLAFNTGTFSIAFPFWNVNIPYRIASAAVLLNIGLAVSPRLEFRGRAVAAALAAVHAYTVFLGPSLGGPIFLVCGGVLFAWWGARRHGIPTGVLVTASTAVSVFAGLVALANLEMVYQLGVFNLRLPMYREAVVEGLRVFPWGGGMSSADLYLADLSPRISREVHNPFLSWWLEFGLLGIVGGVLLFVDWPFAAGRVLRTHHDISGWELAPAAAFFGYFVQQQFQPAPVVRFYWILFAVSWSSLHASLGDATRASVAKDSGIVPRVWRDSRLETIADGVARSIRNSTTYRVARPSSLSPVVSEDATVLRLLSPFWQAWRSSRIRRLLFRVARL